MRKLLPLSPNQLRAMMIALLVVAAVLNVVGQKTGERYVTGVSWACFFLVVALYVRWRQRVRARVYDSEDKTP